MRSPRCRVCRLLSPALTQRIGREVSRMQRRSDSAPGGPGGQVRMVFLDRGTIGPSVDLTKPAFCHEWIEHDATPRDEVVKRLAGARIAITNKVPIRAQHLKELPH